MSELAKHTPTVEVGHTDDTTIYLWSEGQEKYLGEASCEDVPHAEAVANARLWAAAPALLAVAQRIAELTDGTFSEADVLDNLVAIGEQARAALALAQSGPAAGGEG